MVDKNGKSDGLPPETGWTSSGGPSEILQLKMLELLQIAGTISEKELRALKKLRGEEIDD